LCRVAGRITWAPAYSVNYKPMKIALIAPGSSIHTIRWANGLCDAGLEVHLFSLHKLLEPLNGGVFFHKLPVPAPLGYWLNAPIVRCLIKKIGTELVHAHYASGYGLLARKIAMRPTILSVWGSDIFDFPHESKLKLSIIKKNLQFPDFLTSTSHVMARETLELAPSRHGEIVVVPFGVETEKFHCTREPFSSDNITIGTAKVLQEKYGIDTLIEAFSLLQSWAIENNYPRPLRLRVVGEGPQGPSLEKLASELGIGHLVDFIGRVPHKEVVSELNKMDVYVALSRFDSESFGVAVVEAMACCRPVVVSSVAGLAEVVRDKETGLVVPKESPAQAAQALIELCQLTERAINLGRSGRVHVEEHYQWKENVKEMVCVYERVFGSL